MLTLMRLYSYGSAKEGGIYGRLYLNGQHICDTLENCDKAIPAGIYVLKNSQSPRFKRELPLVSNGVVPSSRGIRIHSGNSSTDSAGCILVGMGFNDKKKLLTESKLAETMVTMICRHEDQLVIVEST